MQGDDPRLLGRLRDDLVAAGFSVEGLEAAWGPVAAAALGRDDAVPALAELDRRPTSAVGTLARLFVLGRAVAERDLTAALPALGVAGAVQLGLVTAHGDKLSAQVDLRPYAVVDEDGAWSWWVLSDPGELALGGELPQHHVLGAGAASSTLAGITVPSGTGTVLDLGTGSGIQALHAARSAGRVVGTDVSARALGYARANAVLNAARLETRLGSLYEPVAGERFDRIVSNPPFVITPRGAGVPGWTYRDGGLPGDGLVERIVRGAGEHLNPGGIAQLLGNWEVHGDAAAARERVLGWADGVDAWVVERDLLDPAEYAEAWVRDAGARPGTPRGDALLRIWLDDFAERGVTAVGAGYLTLRRPGSGGPTLRRYERQDQRLEGGVGTAIARALDRHDWSRQRDDDALAAARLRVAGDVTERRHQWPGAADPTVVELVQGGGFGRVRRVDPAVAGVVGACDGELPLGALADAVAALLDLEPAELRGALLPVVRDLLFEGFLEPA